MRVARATGCDENWAGVDRGNIAEPANLSASMIDAFS
jgi:hypothetical protein